MSEFHENLARIMMVEHAEQMRKLSLTDSEVALIRTIESQATVTGSQIANWKSITAANASAKLKRLYDKGYLSRDQKTDPSGGLFYEYYLGRGICYE